MIETLPGLLRSAAETFGDKPALISPNDPPLSFYELDKMADRFAKALLHHGADPGERVCVAAHNSYEWVAAAIGTQRVSGVLIPLYFKHKTAEVVEIIQRAQATYLICSAELAQDTGLAGLTFLKQIVIVPPGNSLLEGHGISWPEFLSVGDSVADGLLFDREKQVNGDTISDIMFTSGTTGKPKGAVFTHRSSTAGARIMQAYNGATEADCFCPMGSFAHVGGYKQGWGTGVSSGASVTWGEAFDGASVLDLVSRMGITIMPAAPITWQGVLDCPDRGHKDISCLRFVATGGTMIPPELVKRLISELDVKQVGTGYGMTETCGMVAYTRPGDPVEKITGTVGQPAPDTEIRIADPLGKEVPIGEAGEILIKNPRLLIEYLDDEKNTREAFNDDGWFRSGDIGSFDTEGYLRITDRLKDMYIINGLNVYPAEIERSIECIEGVQQCAVVGIPESIKGEVGAAFIVSTPDSSIDESNVLEWCQKNLASYKVPKFITLVHDLPRNVMGKVLKTELKKSMTTVRNSKRGRT